MDERTEARTPDESTSQPKRMQAEPWTTRQKWKLTISLIIGALLWFCDWTDYSLPGTWADLALPIAGLVATFVALRASKSVLTPTIRTAAKIAALLTLVDVSMTILVAMVLAIMSPFGAMYAAFSIGGEEQTSTAVSPDGTRIAEEYYEGGGLLSDGVVTIRVKYRLMPLLERDVYRGPSVTDEHVTWEDNDTLYVPGTGEQIRLGLVHAELAPAVQYGIAAWGLFGVLSDIDKNAAETHKRDEEMSQPLKDIPLYPGRTENDYSGANMIGGGGFRAFDIKGPSSDDAAKWYTDALSQGPWSVVSTKRRETYGSTAESVGDERLVYDCIEAVRQEDGGEGKHYYWEFLWGEQSNHVRVIVNTPEPPAWSDCDGPQPIK
jgi:hypothetical protein